MHTSVKKKKKKKVMFNIAIILQTHNKRLKGCNANLLSRKKILHLEVGKIKFWNSKLV